MRVAIVNDMLMATEVLRRVVTSRPEYTLAWTAQDGAEAVRRCQEDRPDIILMDLIMPVMNGAEATGRIMRATPCAILVVTATVDGNMALVFEAMGLGALDAVNTPVLGPNGDIAGAAALLYKMDLIARLVSNRTQSAGSAPSCVPAPAGTSSCPLLLLGASTGGPAALATILARLPADFPAAIVIVQHVDLQFAADLAVWLGRQTALPVRIVEPGVRPVEGVVLLAGTNDHLIDRGIVWKKQQNNNIMCLCSLYAHSERECSYENYMASGFIIMRLHISHEIEYGGAIGKRECHSAS